MVFLYWAYAVSELSPRGPISVQYAVGQEDQPVRTGVGVGVLLNKVRAEYARLSYVHSL